jgi:hypothetical protein
MAIVSISSGRSVVTLPWMQVPSGALKATPWTEAKKRLTAL